MAVLSETLLWLFVLNLGIAYGAGLYEKRIVVPMWFSPEPGGGLRVNSELMRATDPGMKFWAFVTTLPLTLLTLANLTAALYAVAPRHDWWLLASGITLLERLATFGFFIPTAIKLMKPDAPEPALQALARRWLRLNYLRDALALLGWLAALKTLSLPG